MSTKHMPSYQCVQLLLVDGIARAVRNMASFAPARAISRRTGIPADMWAGCALLSIGGVLLGDPMHIAPLVCNTAVMLPAVSSMRAIGRRALAPELDYWLLIGTAFTAESVIGTANISKLLPIWWLVKFLLAMLTLTDKPSTPARPTLELRGDIIGTLPDRAPSPSPVQAMITALSPTSADPYNTADMIRDNNGPYRIMSPIGPQHGPLDEYGPVGRNREPITTHKIRRKSVVADRPALQLPGGAAPVEGKGSAERMSEAHPLLSDI